MRFLLIDRYESFEPDVRATGITAVSGQLDIFWDHFPGNPVFPGVLIMECLAQAAGGLIALSCDFSQFALLSLISDAKFRDFVRPGDVLRSNVEIEARDAGSARVRGRASVGEREVARVRYGFVLTSYEEVMGERYIEPWCEHMRGLLPDGGGHG